MTSPPVSDSSVVTIGKRIREAREAIGMTREQLAAHFDVTLATAVRWETGRSKHGPSVPTIIKIAELTGRPFAFFVPDEERVA